MKTRGTITHIQPYSLHDGTGIRTLVFLKGCPLVCDWCCNPECQSPHIEIEFYRSRCVRCGACVEACRPKAVNPDLEVESGFKIDRKLCNECGRCVEGCVSEALVYAGKVVTVEDILGEVDKDRCFHTVSDGGLTLSGGEPLHQLEFAHELLRRSYDSHISAVLETCGHAPWDCFERVIPYLDSVLLDIKHMDPVKHRDRTGVSNELILSNAVELCRSGVPIVIRLPLIPGFNLDADNIRKTCEFVASLRSVKEVDLMPFHQLGRDKYFRLSRSYALDTCKALASDEEGVSKISSIRDMLASFDLEVCVC